MLNGDQSFCTQTSRPTWPGQCLHRTSHTPGIVLRGEKVRINGLGTTGRCLVEGVSGISCLQVCSKDFEWIWNDH